MHRLSLALVLGLAACGSFKDTFTSRRDSAAEAGALKLPSDTLARILAGPRGLRLTKDAATFVTNLWVDYALFAQASSSGKLPSDSASATKALWPEVAELGPSTGTIRWWPDARSLPAGLWTASTMETRYGSSSTF
jgi:hypothetical protein